MQRLHSPALSSLDAIQFHDAARNEEQFSGRFLCVYDFTIVIFNNAIQHVEMGSSEDEQTSYTSVKASAKSKRAGPLTGRIDANDASNGADGLNDIAWLELMTHTAMFVIHDILGKLTVLCSKLSAGEEMKRYMQLPSASVEAIS